MIHDKKRKKSNCRPRRVTREGAVGEVSPAFFKNCKKVFSYWDKVTIAQSNNSKNTCIRVSQSISKSYTLLLDRQLSESIEVNNSFSLWSLIKCGLPQGSILDPILFNILCDMFLLNHAVDIASYPDDNTLYNIGRTNAN